METETNRFHPQPEKEMLVVLQSEIGQKFGGEGEGGRCEKAQEF